MTIEAVFMYPIGWAWQSWLRDRVLGGRVEAKIKHALDIFGVEETMQQAETSLISVFRLDGNYKHCTGDLI